MMAETVQAGGSRRCSKCEVQDFNVKIYGGVTELIWTKAVPSYAALDMDDGVYSDSNLKYVKIKSEFIVIDGSSDPTVSKVVVMIGDEEFSTEDNEIAFGGTYCGKIYNPTDGANDYQKYSIKWWIMFNPATTGIDGKIIVDTNGLNSMTNTPTSAGMLPTIEDCGKGYGTGDLGGVKTYDKGSIVVDFSKPMPVWVEHQGTVKCWPNIKYFELLCSGAQDEATGREKEIFCEDVLKLRIIKDREWITGEVVELTVGEETFTPATEPYSVEWTTTFDAKAFFNEDGTNKLTYIELCDVATVFNNGVAVGTLVLKLKSTIDFATTPPAYSGTVCGFGTGALRGVHVSGADLGLVDPVNGLFLRVGAITGWPDYITNS
jgi:hypothetical protein